jgi:prophage antirepressor-like protein
MSDNFVFDILSQVLKYEDNSVKIIFDKSGEPWFGFKDMLKLLGYKSLIKQTSRVRVNANNKKPYHQIDTLIINNNDTGIQKSTMFINEGGLYELVSNSKKDIATRFVNDIMNNILPTLRKTGKYIISDEENIKLKNINETLQKKLELYLDELNYYYDKYEFIPSTGGYIYINEVKTIYKGELITCYKPGYCEDMKERRIAYKVGNFFYKLLCYIPINVGVKKVEKCYLNIFNEHKLKPNTRNEIICFLTLDDVKKGIIHCIKELSDHICHCVHCAEQYELDNLSSHECKKYITGINFNEINLENMLNNNDNLNIIDQKDIVRNTSKTKVGKEKNSKSKSKSKSKLKTSKTKRKSKSKIKSRSKKIEAKSKNTINDDNKNKIIKNKTKPKKEIADKNSNKIDKKSSEMKIRVRKNVN